MNNNDLFNEVNDLPIPLSKRETYELFDKMNNGSIEARDKIITHNIRLVIYQVTTKFKDVDYEKKDLVSVGNIGLIKAVNTFDISKNFTFATYATKCINNEIILFLKKLKTNQNIDSLDKIIVNQDGNDLRLEDFIADDENFTEIYENKENYKIIRDFVNNLPYYDRQIIMMYFGFYNNKLYKQHEIADKLNISQSYVSRLIKKIIKDLGKKLKKCGVIEITDEKLEEKNKVLQLTTK